MDPKKLAVWIGGCVAILTALGGGWKAYGGISDGIAQEAKEAGADTAAVVVEQFAAPMLKRLESIEVGQERDHIEEKWDQCMRYDFPDEPLDVRRMCCDEERDWRWAVWEWEQDADTDEPEPELEPCP